MIFVDFSTTLRGGDEMTRFDRFMMSAVRAIAILVIVSFVASLLLGWHANNFGANMSMAMPHVDLGEVIGKIAALIN